MHTSKHHIVPVAYNYDLSIKNNINWKKKKKGSRAADRIAPTAPLAMRKCPLRARSVPSSRYWSWDKVKSPAIAGLSVADSLVGKEGEFSPSPASWPESSAASNVAGFCEAATVNSNPWAKGRAHLKMGRSSGATWWFSGVPDAVCLRTRGSIRLKEVRGLLLGSLRLMLFLWISFMWGEKMGIFAWLVAVQCSRGNSSRVVVGKNFCVDFHFFPCLGGACRPQFPHL